MGDRPDLLERLRRLLGVGPDGDPPPSRSRGPAAGASTDCGDGEEVSCREAARRVYEYLDGELDEDRAEAIRCHVEECERCYPMYDWEQLFLEALRERGPRPERNDELRSRVRRLLEARAG